MNEQEIFLAALDIQDPVQRKDYLQRVCAGNPTLHRRIEELLAVHDRSGEFLDVPALQQMAGDVTEPDRRYASTNTAAPHRKHEIDLSFLQPAKKPGSLGSLGHYEIEQVLGQGGYGVVLKAFDSMLERVVAIKVIAPELAATSPARKRFLREARAAAALRHENVVGIYAVEDQPIPYLVMEYIAGSTLQQKLDKVGPFAPEEVVRIGQQIAQGLAAAHSLGLIHRDIKPSNILLEEGSERVKITDFGLARTADDASITQSGNIAGTPLYMSPEQALGQSLDPRSDLFSLGSVLYAMCSGRPPFRAPSTLGVLKRVVEDTPRPIQEVIPEVPDWLCAIIAKLHAKNREERIGSAKEVAEWLGRCAAESKQRGRVEALTHLQPASPHRTDKPPTRSRYRWITAAALLLVLFTSLGLAEATGVTNFRGTVIRLFSPDGTLIVEVDDPAVSVSIDGEDMVITGAGAKEIRLKPGQYKLLASREGKILRQELVTVTTNGRQVVRVSKETLTPPAVDVPPLDPERAAVQTLSDLGLLFHVKMNHDGKQLFDTHLPKEPCQVFGVINPNKELTREEVRTKFLPALLQLQKLNTINSALLPIPLTAEDLLRLADAPAGRQLDWLNCRLDPTPEILRALVRFPRLSRCSFRGPLFEGDTARFCKQLPRGITSLMLLLDSRSRMDRSDIAALTALPLLRLAITYSKIDRDFVRAVAAMPELKEFSPFHWGTDCPLELTDEIAEVLATSKSLEALRLEGNQLTDKGLESLAKLKTLRGLVITHNQGRNGVKITQAGIDKFADALPKCQIIWDGGTINPRK
ncbi:MAG: protein kinase [Gemmataceae bacterium]